MASRKFPRDRRQWWRMTCDILDDPKIEQLTGDEFRMFVNILAALARSGSRDGTIELGPRALCRLACKHQTRHAEPIARRLADVGLTTSRRDGDVTLTTVPNWAKLQGFDCTNRVEKRREEKIEREPAATPPPDPDLISQSDITPTGPNVNTSDTSPEPVAKIAKRKQVKPKGTRCPEELTAEQWEHVEAWRIKKHPEIPAASLPGIWENHALWYISKRKPGLDWVRSFQLWILRDFKNPTIATAATHRPPPPVWKAPQGPKFSDADPESIAKALEESRKSRKNRRLTAEPKPPLAEEGGAF